MTGFDIGEKQIKIACYAKGVLHKTVCAPVPEGLVSDGAIKSMDAMADFIAQLAKENELPKKDAALVLPASQVHVRTTTLAAMSDKLIAVNLPYEFKDYLTEEKSGYVFDYEVLETQFDEGGNPKEQRLFACAASKALIAKYEAMFSRAGYKLKSAVPEEFVFSRLCRGDTGMKLLADKVCAFVDLGEKATNVHIVKCGEYDTKRSIDVGILDLENVVADEMDCAIYTAIKHMQENTRGVMTGKRCSDLYNHLAVEIMKAANFYNYNNRDVELRDLYLIGGGTAIKPLTDTVEQVTGLNIHSVNELLYGRNACEEGWLFLKAICTAANE